MTNYKVILKEICLSAFLTSLLCSLCWLIIKEEKVKIISPIEKELNMIYEKIDEIECENVSKVVYDVDKYTLAEELYGVESTLLEAIERWETGHYTSDLFVFYNNSFGGYDSLNGDWMKFDSEKQSTVELARLLRKSYIDNGLDTIESIGSVYCPDNLETLDVNEAEEWAKGVKSIYLELGGEMYG